VRVIGAVCAGALRIELGELSIAATLAELAEAHGALAELFG
jgi:hypothetical protein